MSHSRIAGREKSRSSKQSDEVWTGKYGYSDEEAWIAPGFANTWGQR